LIAGRPKHRSNGSWGQWTKMKAGSGGFCGDFWLLKKNWKQI
jgi:hypothetical protein